MEQQRKREKMMAYKQRKQRISINQEPVTMSLEAKLRSLIMKGNEKEEEELGQQQEGSSISYVLINDISYDKLCIDMDGVLYKTQLVRQIRHTLGVKGQAVVLRSSLSCNSVESKEEEEHECRQALMSLYLACIDLLSDDAPPITFDCHTRTFECILIKKKQKT